MECPECSHGMTWYEKGELIDRNTSLRASVDVYVCPHCQNHVDVEENEPSK